MTHAVQTSLKPRDTWRGQGCTTASSAPRQERNRSCYGYPAERTISRSSGAQSSSRASAEGEDRDTLLHYYAQMVLIRHFEEKASEMYTKARIGG